MKYRYQEDLYCVHSKPNFCILRRPFLVRHGTRPRVTAEASLAASSSSDADINVVVDGSVVSSIIDPKGSSWAKVVSVELSPFESPEKLLPKMARATPKITRKKNNVTHAPILLITLLLTFLVLSPVICWWASLEVAGCKTGEDDLYFIHV